MLSPCSIFPLASAGSVALAILGIGFLIFVHELGHFLACRLTGTRVETFSIGFGTRLFGWENLPGEPKRFTVGRRRLDPEDHAMDFRVAVVPLGGYVKMAGENLGEDRTGAPDEFPSKPMWARVFIISAGVIMNVITAFVFYLVAYASHIEQPPAVIGSVSPGGAAWEAKLEPGDRIISLGGARTRSFLELKMETVFLPGSKPAVAVVEREGTQSDVEVTPQYDEDVGAMMLEIRPPATLVIEEGERKFEIFPTDRVEIDGVAVTGGFDASDLLQTTLHGLGTVEADVRLASGEALPLRFASDPTADGAGKHFKVGIEPWGIPEVKAVRGPTADTLRVGDRVVAAIKGGERYPLDSQARILRLAFQAPVEALEVQRSGETLTLPIPGPTAAELYSWLRDVDIEVETTAAARPLDAGEITLAELGQLYRYPSAPAADAGLRPGDVILRVGKVKIEKWEDVIREITSITEAKPITLDVRGTDGEERTLTMTPVALEPLKGPKLSLAEYWEPYESDGIFDAAGVAFARTGREIQNVFRLIGAFFSGRLSFRKNVGGPATIVMASSSAAQRNWLHFLTFLAYISVTLAVLNILPIPVLDGGHLMFILIERVKGSPLKESTMGKFQFVGLMLLLLLMFFAFWNDFNLLVN